jgi:hypothetical protein
MAAAAAAKHLVEEAAELRVGERKQREEGDQETHLDGRCLHQLDDIAD